MAPINLRVFGDGVCPIYTAGQDIAVTWDQTSPERCSRPAKEDLTDTWSDRTLLQVLDAGTLEVKGIGVVSPSGTATIANADLVAALGSETDFIPRAYSQRAGLNSLTFDQVRAFRT